MKAGDIVYFKSEYKARYSRQGGSYEYYFKPGDRYRIETINGVGIGTILNLVLTLMSYMNYFLYQNLEEQD